MVLAAWLDFVGCMNTLPRILMVFIWNMATLFIFFWMYWFNWVWFRALIAGSSMDTNTVKRKAKIAVWTVVALNLVAEVVQAFIALYSRQLY